jgi:hypothetical protein
MLAARARIANRSTEPGTINDVPDETEDSTIRRMLLKPLARRRKFAHDREGILRALERLDGRVIGQETLQEVREALSAARLDRKADSWKDPARARRFIALARALRASRRISRQEYVFYASSPVNWVHEGRWMDGYYDDDLREIQEGLKAVEREYGLAEGEYWPRGQGPKAYQRLNQQYSSVLDGRFVKALRELGLDDLADLRERAPDEFDSLLERGRRAAHHPGDTIPALRDMVVRYEADASRAASARAYSAAVTLLGAGLEGLLLIRCLRPRRKAQAVARSLPRRMRPQVLDEPTRWRFETLIETCHKAGWFPRVSTPVAEYRGAGLAHLLQEMRNFVHPGRRVRERPWSEADEEDYRDAEAIYTILRSKMIGESGRTGEGPEQRPSQG